MAEGHRGQRREEIALYRWSLSKQLNSTVLAGGSNKPKHVLKYAVNFVLVGVIDMDGLAGDDDTVRLCFAVGISR